MNKFHKLGLFSWICQVVCLILIFTIGYEQLFLVINILFFNTTMAFWFIGNNRDFKKCVKYGGSE